MKKIIFSVLVVIMTGAVFAIIHPALADGPEFMPPACATQEQLINGKIVPAFTCGYYTVDRTINFTPALTDAFVFTYLPRGTQMGAPYYNTSYTILDTSAWNVLAPVTQGKLQLYGNIVPSSIQAIPKNYFNSNGGMDGLFIKSDSILTTTNANNAPPACPNGYYPTSYGSDYFYCIKETAIKPAAKSHIFDLYVVAVKNDKYDLPDYPRTTVKAGTLIPWSKGDPNPYVQTELGNPLSEKRLIYTPLGIIGNKIIFYRSQEVYYINQGTAKTVSRTVDLPVPVVPGIQPLPGTAPTTVSSTTSTPQTATATTATSATGTDQGTIHPITPESPSFAHFIGSFFSGFGKFLQSLFRF